MKRSFSALAVLAALLVALGAAAPARAAADPNQAAQAALGWLLGRQQDNGGFAGFDAGSSADAIFAIAAVGSDPNGVLKSGGSPVSYLGTQAAGYAAKSPAAAGKLALAVVAAGKDPRDFGGQNLIQVIQSSYSAKTGRYGADVTGHVYALLALASAGQPIPPEGLDALGKLQLPDGGWSFDGSAATGSDTNTTALAIQALVAAKAPGGALARGLAYLHAQQNADGGFPYSKTSSFGADTDANSTAVVIQAIAAAGQDPRGWKQSGGDPIEGLLKLQNSSGAFRYQAAVPDDNDLATAQAVPALLLKPFPIKTVSLPPVRPAPASLPKTGGEPDLARLVGLALLLLAAGLVLRPRSA